MRIRVDPSITADLVYWISNSAGRRTQTAPLPVKNRFGVTTIGVPRAYASPVSKLWILNTGARLAAQLPMKAVIAPSLLNLVRNGDFMQGAAGWTVHYNGPRSEAVQIAEAAPTDAPPGMTGRAIRCAAGSGQSKGGKVTLWQDRINLERARAYVLGFWVKADAPDTITVRLSGKRIDGGPSRIVKTMAVSVRWQKVTIQIQPGGAGRSRLEYSLSANAGALYLAAIALHPVQDRVAADAASLGPVDFKYAHEVAVRAVYRGLPVSDGLVTLKAAIEPQQSFRIVPGDAGIAHFLDVPIGTPLEVTVRNGGRAAHFTRTVRAVGITTLPPVALPIGWTDVTTAGALQANQMPPNRIVTSSVVPRELLGSWTTSPNKRAQTFQFLFRPDHTGELGASMNEAKGASSGPKSIVSHFEWYAASNGKLLVIGSAVYAWSIHSVPARGDSLVLTNAAGQKYLLHKSNPS